jgi:hypothetical protein
VQANARARPDAPTAMADACALLGALRDLRHGASVDCGAVLRCTKRQIAPPTFSRRTTPSGLSEHAVPLHRNDSTREHRDATPRASEDRSSPSTCQGSRCGVLGACQRSVHSAYLDAATSPSATQQARRSMQSDATVSGSVIPATSRSRRVVCAWRSNAISA